MDANVLQMLDVIKKVELKRTEKLAVLLSAGTDLTVSNIQTVGYQLPKAFTDELANQLFSIWQEASRQSSPLVAQSLIKSFTYKNLADPILEEYVNLYGYQAANSIASTTQAIVVQKVRRGLARGQSLESLVRQILNESPQISTLRARVIVSNEAHAAAQFTSQRVATASGRLIIKTWNSVKDDRTRRFGLGTASSDFNHLVMDGQRRPLQDLFSVPTRLGGFENILFPGDPNGSAGNTINCRCIQTYEEAI